MITIIFAAAAAIGWGAADFVGGDASRHKTSVFMVVAMVQLLGLLALVPVLLTRGVPLPDNPRMLLALLSGLAVTCELGLIYRAISRGDAFITAPVAALGAGIAVIVGLISGEPLTIVISIGLALALLGGGVSAWTSPTTRRLGGSPWRTAAMCAAAAAAVGTMLICLHAAGRLDPYWATAIEHASCAVSAGIAALVGSRRSLRHCLPKRPEMPKLGLIAIIGTGGDLAFTISSRGGALSIVSAIASLYPVVTIALGALLLGQRARRFQLGGILLAITGAILLGSVTR